MDTVKAVVKKVEKTVSRYRMLERGEKVVVAVSGGADSVCLLDILDTLKGIFDLNLVVAHFDHGLRPAEDEGETDFVRSLSGFFGCDFVTKRAEPHLSGGSGSMEERARDARYRFLLEASERTGAAKIATGHNLNDQAETVLMRLLRGSGPSGLAGIPPVRDGRIIRPLIEVNRREIEEYLSAKGLCHVNDSSNSETKYLRNRIRIDLLPQLEEYQPGIVEVLGRTAEIMGEQARWIEATAADWLDERAGIREGKEAAIPLGRFLELPGPLKGLVVREALRRVGGGLRRIGIRGIRAITDMAEGERPQAEVMLPGALCARRVYGTLIFSRSRPRPAGPFCYLLEKPGLFEFDPPGCALRLEEFEKVDLPQRGAPARHGLFDADLITYPLTLRSFLPGDRFVPLGMKGRKKVKDLFIDLKVPSPSRARIPLLVQGNTPIWVCGLRIDDRFKVGPGTRRVLKVTFEPRDRVLAHCLGR